MSGRIVVRPLAARCAGGEGWLRAGQAKRGNPRWIHHHRWPLGICYGATAWRLASRRRSWQRRLTWVSTLSAPWGGAHALPGRMGRRCWVRARDAANRQALFLSPSVSLQRGFHCLEATQELAVAQSLEYGASTLQMRSVASPLGQHNAHPGSVGNQPVRLGFLNGSG